MDFHNNLAYKHKRKLHFVVCILYSVRIELNHTFLVQELLESMVCSNFQMDFLVSHVDMSNMGCDY